MPDEALSGEAALGQQMGRGKRHDMVGDGLVDGGAADLDHLEPRRRLQHPVADLRRLQHAVAGLEQEGLPLVLIDEARPALAAIDHLEADLVEMDIVGRPARPRGCGYARRRSARRGGSGSDRDTACRRALRPSRRAPAIRVSTNSCRPSGNVRGGSASTSSILVPPGAIISPGVPAGSAALSQSRRSTSGLSVSPPDRASSRRVTPCPETTATEGESAGRIRLTLKPSSAVKKRKLAARSGQGSTTWAKRM